MLEDNAETVKPDKSITDSYLRFVSSLPGRQKTERPIVTGTAALKATMLPEQGKRLLTKIKEANIETQKGPTVKK